MNLNTVISVFNKNGLNNIKITDLTDNTKKNDAAVKTIKNIFDTNLDGNLDDTEMALINKLASLDGNNNGTISINDLKLFASLSGSASDISSGDLSILKSGKYSTNNNNINTFDYNNNKTSTTTINNDGSVTTTAYSSDKTQTTIQYTSDYKIKTKTAVHNDGSQEQYTYDSAGVLTQKDATVIDGSKVSTLYNPGGNVLSTTKKDANNNFLSQDEYDYNDYGNKSSLTSYDSNGNTIAKTLYNSDGTQIQVKYDNTGEIIQRDTFNNVLKPLTSFVKNTDGSTLSTTYKYQNNGDVQITSDTCNSSGIQQSEQISTKHQNGKMEVYTNGILTSQDVVNSDNSVSSTVYSASNIISTVTNKNSKGNLLTTDYYTYTGGNINTITEKDASGNITGTGVYSYNNPNQLKSLNHFDAAGNLIDKAIWNLDGTKAIYKYNTTINNSQGTLTENYGTDNQINSTLFKSNDGSTVSSTYVYNVPNSGDSTINGVNLNSNGVVTNLMTSIAHKDGTSENSLYNGDKTQLLEKDTTDKYGNKVITIYNNNQIASVTKTNSNGTATGKDNYNYNNGILMSVDHFGVSNKSTGTTQYDASGNTKDFDSTGNIIASKTTDKITNAVTTQFYQYTTTGSQIIKTNVTLNGKLQSSKTQTINIDKSIDTSISDQTGYNLLQKDHVNVDGTIKSTIYDPVKNRVTSVINKDSNGNVLLTNQYTYGNYGTVDHINCYDANNKLTENIKIASNGGKIITNYDGIGNIKNITTYDIYGNVISMQ